MIELRKIAGISSDNASCDLPCPALPIKLAGQLVEVG
jgi:hypothetical protein